MKIIQFFSPIICFEFVKKKFVPSYVCDHYYHSQIMFTNETKKNEFKNYKKIIRDFLTAKSNVDSIISTEPTDIKKPSITL